MKANKVYVSWVDLEGGFRGLQPPKWSESHCAIDVLSHADALIYIAKSLVVVVVMF